MLILVGLIIFRSCAGNIRCPWWDHVYHRVSIEDKQPGPTDIPSIILEGGIYCSHIVWRIRYRKVIKEAKATGKTVDEILEPEQYELDVEKGEDSRQRLAQDERTNTNE